MKNRPTMDTTLRMIEQLYEGDGNLADRLREEQPSLINEFESMRSLKSALDARPGRRPDRSAVDAVLKAAADASEGLPSEASASFRRQDRKPRARRGVYLRSAGVATALVTLLIAVTTVWQADLLDEISPVVGARTAQERAGLESESSAGPAYSPGASEAAGARPDRGVAGAGLADADAGLVRADAGALDLADAGAADLADAGARSGEDRARASEFRAGQDASATSKGTFRPLPSIGDDEASSDARRRSEVVTTRDVIAPQEVASSAAMQSLEAPIRLYRPTDFGYAAMHNQARLEDPMAGGRPSDILPIGVRPLEGRAFYEDAGSNHLAWDQVADVVEMYHQIEMIEEGVARGWEPPSVPLEMVPTSQQQRGANIQPAGNRRVP